jgi:hypothetical protein
MFCIKKKLQVGLVTALANVSNDSNASETAQVRDEEHFTVRATSKSGHSYHALFNTEHSIQLPT